MDFRSFKTRPNLPVAGSPGLIEAVEQTTAIGDSMLRKSDARVAILFITDGSIHRYRGDYTSSVINPSDNSDLSRRFRDRLIQEKIRSCVITEYFSHTAIFSASRKPHQPSELGLRKWHPAIRSSYRRRSRFLPHPGRDSDAVGAPDGQNS